MDFQVITKAGLNNSDVATILGVSQVSVWKYRKGVAAPRKNFMGVPIQARMNTLMHVLERLLERGSLPKVDLAFAKNMDPERKAKRAAVMKKIKQLVDERVAQEAANT